MLIMVVLIAQAAVAGELGRPGSAGPLAPAARPLGDRPHHGPRGTDHARLRAGGEHRGAARGVGAGDVLPGHAGRDGRLRPADHGGDQLLPACPAPAQVRDLVGHSPVPVPRARDGVRPPDLHRRLLHRPPAGAGAVDRGLGGHRGAGARCTGSRSRSGGACGTSSGWSRSARRRPGSSRWSAGGGTSTGWRCPAASSSTGTSSPGGCGGRGTRTRCPPCRGRRTSGSPSRGSATRAGRRPACGPGTRVAIEGPYGTFTDHARLREGVALFAAGVGITPVRALLEDLPAGVDVVVVVRASTPADLVHRDEVAALVRQRRGRLQEIVGLAA